MVFSSLEWKVANIEFESFWIFALSSLALLVIAIGVTNANLSTVDIVAIQLGNCCVGLGLLAVGDESESTVYAVVISEDDAVGHVTVFGKECSEFFGSNFSW